MNIFNLLKLANKLDKQGKYSTSDSIFKFVQAQTDDFDFSQDPLGMSVPNERKDKFADLRAKLERGEISEDEFNNLFIEMVEATPVANAADIDNFQTRLQESGVQTFGQDRAFLEQATEFADDTSVMWISDLEDDAEDFFRENGVDVNYPGQAGDMLLDLAQANPINNLTINDAIRAITPFQDFYDYFDDYLKSRVPEMVDMIEEAASRSPYNKDIQVTEQEVLTALEEANVNQRNVNTALENVLVKILVSKVR
jgi:hypothetical protein